MSDERTATRDEIPASIGRYQITGSLGFGAMGAVYKAFDPLIKRTLAIKTIRLDIPRNSPQHRAFIERFYQEARISGTLSHPNIVTLFDIGEENGLPFLAMEFVDGKTIAAVIEEGVRFKPERVIALVSQVASALDYAHSRGVVHRDIKPSNLILSDGDKVKVTDFGIAKLVDSEITHSGALLGTPSYMSPEQAMGEKLDGRSDIFSLGVCAFEMLSGQQPFPGANVTSILYKLVHVEPVEPPDLEMNGLVPQKWREVFSTVLAKKPANRYQTASAFVEDLEYCLGSWFTGIGGDAVVAAGGPAPVGIEPTVTVRRPALPQDDLPITSELETLVRTPPEGTRSVSGPAEPAGLVPVEPGEVPTVRLPPRPTSPPAGPIDATLVFGEVPPSPTVLLSAEATTTQVPPSLPESPPEAASTRPPEPAAAKPLPPRPGLPVGAVVGGVAALLLVAAGIVGWALWQRSRVPAPEAAAVPIATAPEPSATAAPPAAPSAPAAAAGALRILSEPAGARVRVDGEVKGQTPLDLADLPLGSHEVRFDLRGFEPQARTAVLSAEVPSAEVKVSLARATPTTGTADILSTPAGATVSVDGKPAGRTPLSAVALKPGARRVEISLEGHEPWSGTVDVVAGQKGRVEVRLKLIPAAKPEPTPEPVDTARVYSQADVDTQPRRRSGESPSYPRSGAPKLRSGDRVSVTVRFVVTETGDVQDVSVVESAGKAIDAVVVQAVKGWKYEPATKRGVKVRSQMLLKQTFLGG
jgi:TonB family protein